MPLAADFRIPVGEGGYGEGGLVSSHRSQHPQEHMALAEQTHALLSPVPTLRGTPHPLERQGGGGHSLMKPRGYPLPVPFLGDELNGVSDVNPCRKTGGGCHLGYLGGGCLPKTRDAKVGYPHPPGAPDRHTPPQKIGRGWSPGTKTEQTKNVLSDVKSFPENGVNPHPRVPGRGGVLRHAGWREGGGGAPAGKKDRHPLQSHEDGMSP
jgi:hypothetical protein